MVNTKIYRISTLHEGQKQFWFSAFPISVIVKIVYKPIRHLNCVVVLNLFRILMLTGSCSLVT
jgi:hypothetical protein